MEDSGYRGDWYADGATDADAGSPWWACSGAPTARALTARLAEIASRGDASWRIRPCGAEEMKVWPTMRRFSLSHRSTQRSVSRPSSSSAAFQRGWLCCTWWRSCW